MTALEHLHNLRDKFVRTVAAMDSVLQIWQGDSPEAAVAQLPPPIVQTEPTQAPPVGRRKPKAKAAKASHPGAPELVAWLESAPGTFGAADLAQALNWNPRNAGVALPYYERKGIIRRVGRGLYESASKAARVVVGKPLPSPKVKRTGGQHVSGQYDAIVEVLEAEPITWLTAKEIEARISSLYPQLVETASQCSDLRVRLIDLSGNGKLRRRGIGSAASYQSVGRVAAEPALNISVPRDLE